jgi:hypothetical protein
MENQPVNLSLSDLVMLKNAVSVACERGAFRAEEMSGVGGTYDRLTAWLAQMTANVDQASESSVDPQKQGE